MTYAKANHRHFLIIVAIFTLIPFWSVAAEKSNLRGQRYCEIIIPKSFSDYAVYNTWGLNDCPQDIWSKITVSGVKKEMGVHFAHLNGPRYWVIDGFKNTTLINPMTKTICGLPLREAGVLHISLFELLKSSSFYKEHIVARQTTWIFDAGKPVYELISPTNKVFVMQSYSVQNTAQTPESLSQLGIKLNLPTGWKFKTGTLKKLELLQAIDNKATVIQDDLLNTYQLATHDFIEAQ